MDSPPAPPAPVAIAPGRTAGVAPPRRRTRTRGHSPGPGPVVGVLIALAALAALPEPARALGPGLLPAAAPGPDPDAPAVLSTRSIVDERTVGATAEIGPGLEIAAGVYRGDSTFVAPFSTMRLERALGDFRWGGQASLFWLDGEPYLGNEDRDSALRTFLSGYYTAPSSVFFDGRTGAGRYRSWLRLGARMELEHVLPDLSLAAAWSQVLVPAPGLELFAHLVPALSVPDVEYDLATTDLDLILTPQPQLRLVPGIRLLEPLGPGVLERIELRGLWDQRPVGNDLGVEVRLRRADLDLVLSTTLTRAYGGEVRTLVHAVDAGWDLPWRPTVGPDTLDLRLTTRAAWGVDRFGTVRDDLLQAKLGVEIRWGPSATFTVGYLADLGELAQDQADFTFSEEERDFIDELVVTRDRVVDLIGDLDVAIADFTANPRPPGPAFFLLVQRTSLVLGRTATLLEGGAAVLPNLSPGFRALLQVGAARIRSAQVDFDEFFADPDDPELLEAILGTLADVEQGLIDALDARIVGRVDLDEIVTRLATEPRELVQEVATDEINQLIRDLDDDDQIGFLFEEVDVLLMVDWKASKARDLEPVTARGVLAFFVGELADEVQDLVGQALTATVDEYEEDPEDFLELFVEEDRAEIERFMELLAELTPGDVLSDDDVAALFPFNTLTLDTAQTLANMINRKVLRARKAFTDFRRRLAVRDGLPLDRILIEDLDAQWEELRDRPPR